MDYLGIFLGAGVVGYALKVKHWTVFLLTWAILLTLVYQITGIQTQLGYYLGITKHPKYIKEKPVDTTKWSVFSSSIVPVQWKSAAMTQSTV